MIPYSKQSINQEDIEEVVKALKSDFLTGGERVEKFEKALCKYLGVKYAVVVNSATSALHLSYLVANLKQDDEIITTALTFTATSSAMLMVGAKPIFCDIKEDGNIDESKIEALITPQTKAIVPVDYGGMPINIKEIQKIAKKHSLLVIEDACHGLGSKYEDGMRVGAKSDIAVFSFHAIKPITTFEGGAIVTNNEIFYKKAKRLSSHNLEKIGLWESKLESVGYNYRLSDVACALGISQLKRVDDFIKKREKIALYYDIEFKNNPHFKTLQKPLNMTFSRHLYPILLNKKLADKKEQIFKALRAKKIGVQVHYKPLYEYKLFKPFCPKPLKNTSTFYKNELSIPCHQAMSTDEAKYVAENLLQICENLS